MFQRISIKSNELSHESLDIAVLIDAMLFYGNVIVLAHRNEIVTLLKSLGEDLLTELIQGGRIDLRIRGNILGAMNFPGGRHNIDLFERTDETQSATLYEAHRILVNNSAKNSAFSEKFTKITTPFKYPKDIVSEIKTSFENVDLLKKILPIYLKSTLPGFIVPEDLEIEITKDGTFGPFGAYLLKTNLDQDKLNQESERVHGALQREFNYGGFLLALAESKGDIFLASQLDSELVTRRLYSDFIAQELAEIVNRRLNSQKNLNLFEEYVLENCYTIGDAFTKGLVTGKELVKLFEKADKFRTWLKKVPEDKNLIGEYYKEVTKESFADKLPTKTTRFMIFEGLGIALDAFGAGGIGTAIGTGLSAIDSFYLDKLLQGWKPSHFIDGELKPLIKMP